MADHKKKNRMTDRFRFAVNIGFFAGFIWGGIKIVEFAMRFTEVVPGFLLEPFYRHAYLVTREGILLGWISFIVFSILASLIYMVLLRKMRGPWPGIAYGAVWWAFLYLLAGPLTEMIPPVKQMDLNSFVSDLGLFLLWGLFIGYTISVEFTDESKREPETSSPSPG